jgi:DNA-binding response OmpR family regulator
VPDIRRLVRTALRFRGGFEVVGEASDGAGAVSLASTLQPDLVVLDLGLPDLAGRDVLGGIRSTSPESKIVVFSGTETSDKAWIAERVEGYVLKDADLDYLIDLLESLGRQPEKRASVHLPHDLANIARARRFLRQTFRDWGLLRLVDDALVVVSELVANAMTHANSGCELRLSLTDSSARIEVFDDGPGTPDPKPSSVTREHGRGLYLVTALTTAWGIELIPDDGKLVWAELMHSA